MRTNHNIVNIAAAMLMAMTVATSATAGDIVAAGATSYWLKNDGKVYGWGRNQEYQIGDRTNTEHYEPTEAYKLTDAQQIVSGVNCLFVVKTDGTLACYGSGNKGQLGIGKNEQKWPEYFSVGYRQKVVQLVSANQHCLAVTHEGELYAWGDNEYGQNGQDNSGTKSVSQPRQRMSGIVVKEAAVGDNHSAVVTADNKLYTFGRNNNGQLADNTTTDRFEPQPVMDQVVHVFAGGDYTAAVKADGSLWLNQGATHGMARILEGGIRQVVIAGNHIYALKKSHELYAATIGATLVKVLDGVQSINGCGDLAFAILTDKALWQCSQSPKKLLDNVVRVSTSGEHTLALTTDGSLYAWGKNNQSQLANRTRVDEAMPKLIGKDPIPETQGVATITPDSQLQDNRVYNLSGQSVPATTSPKSGIYIVNGRKVIR